MLKDLTKQDWLSFLGIPEELVPRALLLRGTRNLKSNYAKHKALFHDVLEVGSPNGIFEDVFIGRRGEAIVGYASVYGDAMASEITHVFGVLGTSLVIQTGCCGALGDGILPGDLVCATAARCGEGASQYYVGQKREVRACPGLFDPFTSRLPEDLTMHVGPIWTTSALLAEGKEEIESWRRQGCIAVDMESASTFAVAEHFGMDRTALLFAFDNPCLGEHILLSDESKDQRRTMGESAMIDLAVTVAEADHETGLRDV
jgi:uridine phosphorylase